MGKGGKKAARSRRRDSGGAEGAGRCAPGRRDLSGHDVSRWVSQALQLRQEGRELEAIGHLMEALRQVGRSGRLAQCLGLLYAAREDYLQAERWLNEAIGWEPRQGAHHYYLGMAYAAQHRFDEAVLAFAEAARLGGQQGEAASAWRLARQCADSQRGERIGDLMQTWTSAPADQDQDSGASLSGLIAQEPDYVEAFTRSSGDAPDREELERVLWAVDEALRRHGASSALCYQRATLLERLGRISQAVRWARRALSMDGQEKRAWVLLGQLYRRAGRTQKAAGALREALRAGARYADVYLHLGQAYEQLGAQQAARRHYEQALAVNGRYDAARQALAVLDGQGVAGGSTVHHDEG